MNYKIAICDDSYIDTLYVSGLVNRWTAKSGHTVQTSTFVSAENFLFRYAEKNDYDILLLDIEMGTMDGLTLAKRIREENEFMQIVFITGFPEFMAEGYEVSALHYLVKPVAREKLFAVLERLPKISNLSVGVWQRKLPKRSFACFEVNICYFKNGLINGSRRTKAT